MTDCNPASLKQRRSLTGFQNAYTASITADAPECLEQEATCCNQHSAKSHEEHDVPARQSIEGSQLKTLETLRAGRKCELAGALRALCRRSVREERRGA